MEKHSIVTEKVSPQSDANTPLSYVCSKCGKKFGQMSFDQSQMLDTSGCSGMKKYSESIPSPFQIADNISGEDYGHEGLVKDLYHLYTEAEQFMYHDFKNKKYPMPKVALVVELEAILNRVKNGYYDNKTI